MAKIAFVFSGQGAQYSGMGMELAKTSKAAYEVFRLADSIRPGTSEQCFRGSAEELKATRNTQPCLFCVDLAAALSLRENGVEPDYLAGFSLGEIPALVFGGYLSMEDAFHFVKKRGEYMDDCGIKNPGIMYAVLGLNYDTVIDICSLNKQWYPVNFNSDKQVVVACTLEQAEGLPAEVIKSGGKVIKLPVSGGFHSPMMDEAKLKLENEFLSIKFKKGKITVYSNVTGLPYNGLEQIFQQINSPVLWYPLICNLAEQGVDTFVEVGPGKTLSNIINRILPKTKVLNVEDYKSLERALEELKC